MATNNMQLFDANKGNMMSTQEYLTNQQRLNGVQQGIASSMLQNKVLYQVSLVAYAIGQAMVNNGLNASDDDAVSTFVGNLANTFVQKIIDKASTPEAQAGVDVNKFMTPATTLAAINFLKATSQMATVGTDNTHWMTPLLVKQMIGSLNISNYQEKYSLKETIILDPNSFTQDNYFYVNDSNFQNMFNNYDTVIVQIDSSLISMSGSLKIFLCNSSNNQLITIIDCGGSDVPSVNFYRGIVRFTKLGNNISRLSTMVGGIYADRTTWGPGTNFNFDMPVGGVKLGVIVSYFNINSGNQLKLNLYCSNSFL